MSGSVKVEELLSLSSKRLTSNIVGDGGEHEVESKKVGLRDGERDVLVGDSSCVIDTGVSS